MPLKAAIVIDPGGLRHQWRSGARNVPCAGSRRIRNWSL